MSKCRVDIRKDIEDDIIARLPDFNYDPQYKEFIAPMAGWNKDQMKYIRQISAINELFKTKVILPADVNHRPGAYEMKVPEDLVDIYWNAYLDLGKSSETIAYNKSLDDDENEPFYSRKDSSNEEVSEIPEYIPSSLEEVFAENYVPRDQRTVRRILNWIDVKKLKFRKKNHKLNIDKNTFPLDRLYEGSVLDMRFSKTADIAIIGKKVFIKAGSNLAMKEFYPFLDYRNPIKLKRTTYLFLTDRFTTYTQRELREKNEFDMKFAIAAGQGRYGIKPVGTPRVTATMKNRFLAHLKKLKTDVIRVPETVLENLDKYKKYLEKFSKSSENYDDPKIRKEAIENIVNQAVLFDPRLRDQFETILKRLPTIALVNMNLNFMERAPDDPFIDQDINNRYNLKQYTDFPFDIENTVNTELRNDNFFTFPSENSLVPQEKAFKKYIDIVNNQIFTNTFVTKITREDDEILEKYGYRGQVGKHKTKFDAVLIEMHKNRSYRLANIFIRGYVRLFRQHNQNLRMKLVNSVAEENPSLDSSHAYYHLTDQHKEVLRLKALYETISQTAVYTPKFNVNILPSSHLDNMTNLDENHKAILARIAVLDNTEPKENEYSPASYAGEVVYNTGLFIYDMAAYSPLLTQANQIIESLREEWKSEEKYPFISNDKRARFAEIYQATIMSSGYPGDLTDLLQTTKVGNRLMEIINSIINWFLGRNDVTAMDVTRQMIENIHEAIKGTEFVIASNTIFSSDLVNATETIRQIQHGIIDEDRGRGANAQRLDEMFKQKLPVSLINARMKESFFGDMDLSNLESLPEGVDLSQFSIVRLDSLKKIPNDIKFKFGATVYFNQFTLAQIPAGIKDQIGNYGSIRTKDWKDPDVIDAIAVSKTKSQLMTGKSGYGFAHTATYHNKKTANFHYTIGITGKPITVNFQSLAEHIPEALFKELNKWHRVPGIKAMGWFGGVISEDSPNEVILSDFIFSGDHYTISGGLLGEDIEYYKNNEEVNEDEYYKAWGIVLDAQFDNVKPAGYTYTVTEVQSDIGQRSFEISNQETRDRVAEKRKEKGLDDFDYLTEASVMAEYAALNLKNKVEKEFDGWLYVFLGTGLETVLANNPNVQVVRIPTSAHYATLHPNAPVQYYDKMGSVFKNTLSADGNFYEIKREDIAYTDPSSVNSQFDEIIKLGIKQGLRDQKAATPDMGSDQYMALDVLNDNLSSLDIFKKYFNSDAGKIHLEEIKKWIIETFSDEKPMTDSTTEGGEGVLVGPDGQELEDDSSHIEEDTEFDKQVREAAQPKREVSLNMDDILDQLSDAIKRKDQNAINFLKKLLDEYQGKTGPISYQKSLTMELGMEPGLSELNTGRSNINSTEDMKDTSEEVIFQLMEKMAESVNMSYQVITPAMAHEITKNSPNPWNGKAPGFFKGNQIYFVEGKLSLETTFHEFSHPFVRAIRLENPVLFNKIYNRIAATPEGQALIQAVEKVYTQAGESELHKEEVIVRSITKVYTDLIQNLPQSNIFVQIIKDIFYAIKQFLRKLAGIKINVSKLNPETTLEELMKILKEGKIIDINTDPVSNKEIVAYNKEIHTKMAEEMKNLLTDKNNSILRENSATAFEVAKAHLDLIFHDPKYAPLRDLLTDDFGRGHLQEMMSNLGKFTERPQSVINQVQDQISFRESHADAMLNALIRLKDVIDTMYEHVSKLDPKSQDSLGSAVYAHRFLAYWKHFAEKFEESLNVPELRTSDLRTYVGNINKTIRDTDKMISDLYGDLVRDIIWDELRPVAENVERYYTNLLADLEKRGAKPKEIAEYYKEYYGITPAEKEQLDKLKAKSYLNRKEQLDMEGLERKSYSGLRLTRDKFDKLYRGDLGDTNILSYFLEGYMHSPDPVVGGFALFVKKHLTEIMTDFQKDANLMVQDLSELLNNSGYSPSTTSALISKVAYIDQMSVYNAETDEMERKDIWKFISRFKNYEPDGAEKNHAIEVANREYRSEGTIKSYQDLKDAIAAYQTWSRDNMQDEYIPEVYARNLIQSEDDEVGKEAELRQKTILDEIHNRSLYVFSQLNALENAKIMDRLWIDYHYLASVYDNNGVLKTNSYIDNNGVMHTSDTAITSGNDKTGISNDLAIAQRLTEYRNFKIENPVTKVIESPFKWYERSGVFQTSYLKIRKELADSDLSPEEVKVKLKEWVQENTRVELEEDLGDDASKIWARIVELTSKIKDPERVKMSEEIGRISQEIYALKKPYRDTDLQTDGSIMFPKKIERIKQLEVEREALKNKLTKAKGFTQRISERLSELNEIDEEEKTQEDWNEINKLKAEALAIGLDPLLELQLQQYYRELRDLKKKEPTSYYIEAVNRLLVENNLRKIFTGKFGRGNLTNFDGETFLDDKFIEELRKDGKEFDTWFAKNHLRRERYEKGKKIEYWERVSVWTISKPRNPKHYKKTVLLDENKVPVETINRVPSLGYFHRSGKPEFRTGYDPATGKVKYIIGVHKDNKGNFLPRLDAKNRNYINTRYDSLNSDDKKLLDEMVRWHLKIQEGVPVKSRLWMDIPRFRKSALEYAQSVQIKQAMKGIYEGDKKYPILSTIVKGLKLLYQKGKDAPESDYNWQDDITFAVGDLFDTETAKVPMHGTYNMDIDEVSPDITQGMLRYMLATKTQKKLLEIHPVATALKSSLPDKVTGKALNKKLFNFKNIIERLPGKEKSIRKKAIENFIDREFYGKKNAGALDDDPRANQIAKGIFGAASFSFFALDITSAIKNAMGAKFQGLIQAAAGDNMTIANYFKAEAYSTRTMSKISFSPYNRKNKSLDEQKVEIMDPSQGRLEEKLPRILSRTLPEDIANFSWLYSFRKWTELQATLQMFEGIMLTEKVEQYGKEISYADAWELRDGIIELQAGIDPEYNPRKVTHTVVETDTWESIAAKHYITKEQLLERTAPLSTKEEERKNERPLTLGEELVVGNSKRFTQVRNKIHTTFNLLQGSFARFDQPEAQRYLVFRFISFIRRYFTTMFMNRVGMARINPGLGAPTQGFYLSVLKTAIRLFKVGPSILAHLPPREKMAFIKLLVEIGNVLIITMVILPLLDWDEDDPDKYAILQGRSGHLPVPGVAPEDPDAPFKLGGWFHNHLIYLALQIESENGSFLPLPDPRFGLDNYLSTANPQSIAFGPTFNSYVSIFSAMYSDLSGDPDATYKREVGPYKWMDEGGSKWLTYLMRSSGVKGTFVSPELGIKNIMGTRSRSKTK